MAQITGLHGHIRRNTRTTWLIILGFFVAVCLCWVMACATVYAVSGWSIGGDSVGGTFFNGGGVRKFDDEVIQRKLSVADHAVAGMVSSLNTLYVPVVIIAVWFLYFWFNNAGMLSRAMGARALSRFEDPRLFKVVENLSIQVGLPMPCIEVIDSDALNAYAHGWSAETATIGVTRGLLDTLPPRELQAVVAHEYTHVINRDSRVMIVATLFCGIFEDLFKHFWSGITGEHERRADGTMRVRTILNRIAVLPVTIPLFGGLCVCFAACWLPTLIGRARIARSREFLADAGAVEMTKDADALVSALLRLAGADTHVDVAPMYQAMMIFGSIKGMFASHPNVEERVAALRTHAGAQRVSAQQAETERAGTRRPTRAIVSTRQQPRSAAQPRANFGRRPSSLVLARK